MESNAHDFFQVRSCPIGARGHVDEERMSGTLQLLLGPLLDDERCRRKQLDACAGSGRALSAD